MMESLNLNCTKWPLEILVVLQKPNKVNNHLVTRVVPEVDGERRLQSLKGPLTQRYSPSCKNYVNLSRFLVSRVHTTGQCIKPGIKNNHVLSLSCFLSFLSLYEYVDLVDRHHEQFSPSWGWGVVWMSWLAVLSSLVLSKKKKKMFVTFTLCSPFKSFI